MSDLTQGSVYDFNNSIMLKGDFIGFTFNGVHSSELGIIRVSEGDRYNESLLPSLSSKTIDVPGGDGTYYFGTYYTQRQIKITIAFDSLTQSQFTRLTTLFGTKKIVPLIFDESPYKVYYVKINNTLDLTYICFDEDGQRIYKGEGNIEFICYSPYAKSRYKYREEYTISNVPEWIAEDGADLSNLDEWIDSSGIKYKGEYDTYNVSTGKILLWNGGQLSTDFNLYIPFEEGSETIPAFSISLNNNEDQLFVTKITKIKSSDKKIKINTKTNLIEGVDENNKITGSVYNKYIEKGNFFKIPVGESELHTTDGIAKEEIEYSFLYY